MTTSSATSATATPLSPDELQRIDAWWRAANYLSVGQIYLMDNPLLREPLLPEHVKPRLLGHWGTTPGLNFIYAHLNRAIMARDLDMIYVIGPGHGGPGPGRGGVPRRHLQRDLSRHHPGRGGDDSGCSSSSPSPAASPATSPPKPRAPSTRAASWATRSPTPTARPSTTPTWSSLPWSATARPRPVRWPTSWHSNKFVDPARDGAVLPILHLNGYKIANPTVLARIPDEELDALLRGYGHTPYFVAGDDPDDMHQAFAGTLDHCLDEIQEIQRAPATGELDGAPGLADDRAPQPQGLDRPRRGRRHADRGLLALPPGAVRRRPRQRRATA